MFLSAKWDTHFEFTTPKGQIPPRDEKKEDMRGKKKKDWHLYHKLEWPGWNFLNTVFVNPDRHIFWFITKIPRYLSCVWSSQYKVLSKIRPFIYNISRRISKGTDKWMLSIVSGSKAAEEGSPANLNFQI